MSIAPSHLFVNWAPVVITPVLPAATALTLDGVADVKLPRSSKFIKFYGDARRHSRGGKTVEVERGCSITTANIGQAAGLVEGTVCTIVATLQDMNNGTGTGAVTFTLVNAVVTKNSCGGTNNQFGMGTIEFETYGNADDSDNLSFTIAQ